MTSINYPFAEVQTNNIGYNTRIWQCVVALPAKVIGLKITIFVSLYSLRELIQRIGIDHRIVHLVLKVPGLRIACGLKKKLCKQSSTSSQMFSYRKRCKSRNSVIHFLLCFGWQSIYIQDINLSHD
jgi:hypothetical protein